MNHLHTAQKILTQAKPHLVAKYHVDRIGLFGSIVRDDFTSQSDIDIVVGFSKPIGIEFIDLANELEFVLKRKVDLVSIAGIKPGYFREIQSQIVYV